VVYTGFKQLIERVQGNPAPRRVAVACANDAHTLEAVLRAESDGICVPLLFGEGATIGSLLRGLGRDPAKYDIVAQDEPRRACELAVGSVRDGRADFLIKGMVDSGVFLKSVVDKETGLGLGGLMTHLALFEIPSYHKLLAPVDGGMVAYPTLEQKREIIQSIVDTMIRMGFDTPKVGVLACVEKVNPKMPETLEAAELKRMNRDGLIRDCIVEGPISYDCAVSAAIAREKGFQSEVAGDADLLVAPNIHAANILGKVLAVTCGARMAGFIVGARCPVVMTSRGASADEKYLSLALSTAASA
jgi:phosphate butyryltransferase